MNRQLVRLVSVPAALLTAVVACHGSSADNSAYVPQSSTGLAAIQAAADDRTDAALPEAKKDRIVSSCGRHVHIVVAGILDCRFHEKGDRDAKFRVENHTVGIILISPSEGTRATTFTITGLVAGNGYFSVKGKRHDRIKVEVRVAL